MNCPHCKTTLKEKGIQARLDGITEWYNVKLKRDNSLKFVKWDENIWDNVMYYYCANCGEELEFTEEEVIKSLK